MRYRLALFLFITIIHFPDHVLSQTVKADLVSEIDTSDLAMANYIYTDIIGDLHLAKLERSDANLEGNLFGILEDGIRIDHDSSGVIQQALISLDDNNLVLLLKWYNNGLKQEETVKDQNGAGYRKTWYGTGKPEGYMELKDGTIDGRRILWDETGKIILFELWSNDKMVDQIIGDQ